MGEEIQKCPRCGRPFRASIPDVGIQFECATIALLSGGHAEGLPCITRQRDQLATELQTLRTANAALVERVKRLDEEMATLDHEIGNRCAKLRQWGETLVRVGNNHIPPECDEWNTAKGQP